jgi:formaldehyde-activating enzyme involved in methanogenesis
VKKTLLGSVLVTTMIITSCKKDDIILNQQENIEVDSTKKSKVYNFVHVVNKISIKKEEPVKTQPKKSKRFNKFKEFIKSKFKKC